MDRRGARAGGHFGVRVRAGRRRGSWLAAVRAAARRVRASASGTLRRDRRIDSASADPDALVLRVLLALGLIGLTAATATAGAPAATGPTTLLVITVKSVTTKVATTDRPPKGVSKGDRFVFRDRLLNAAPQFGKPRGARVGSDRGVTVLTSKATGTTRGFATLPGGTIRFGGDAGLSDATFRVLGGTGRYDGARGFLAVGPGDAPLNVYHLFLPAKPGGAFIARGPPPAGLRRRSSSPSARRRSPRRTTTGRRRGAARAIASSSAIGSST